MLLEHVAEILAEDAAEQDRLEDDLEALDGKLPEFFRDRFRQRDAPRVARQRDAVGVVDVVDVAYADVEGAFAADEAERGTEEEDGEEAPAGAAARLVDAGRDAVELGRAARKETGGDEGVFQRNAEFSLVSPVSFRVVIDVAVHLVKAIVMSSWLAKSERRRQ